VKTDYILTKDVDVPCVTMQGGHPDPSKRTQVRTVRFSKGEVIKGELKHANNEPATVLAGKDNKLFVFPLSVLKQLTTKEIISNADATQSQPATPLKKYVAPATTTKVKYVDALVVGGLVGYVATFWAQKKYPQYVGPDPKNRLYGAIVLAGIGMFLVYRVTQNSTKIKTQE
jgi:hypothetical protein